ncbi:PVC-type heme-binding CxxCH protein [Agriterribacter sp.]|uniref:PVC-type heme-binding CxxCH protein n=1 Tax=Agriterribacter sp. TaxID=2821509 RepID=UPI002BE90125|nr:PVC-type heme-binding CxxCH protein [Agriterribacter sp.]HRP55178.1 c-type cytochrome [Agriterribacter sp.]
MIIAGCKNQSSSPFSASAIEDLSTFEVAEGFKIELIASEPLVHDPVDMMIDEYGRMYVVEMTGVPFNRSGVGKIILLSDSNGDGKMDSAAVFADSLILPSGIMRWKKGVLVTDPPNLYYMEDTDNDGKADIKTVMLTGFDTSNLEANVNNPEYGIDNWIYLAALPLRGGSIYYGGDSGGVHLPEGSIRFRPDDRGLEALSGHTQFGHTFDKWGHHLMVSNSNHVYHNVLAARYLQRNPDMVISRATETLADHTGVFPITKNPEYQMLTDVGVFTSACGITAYLGGAFPKGYNDDVAFVCEPVSNMVHVDRLAPDGVTFKANRIEERREFLASTDPHARPVNTYIGPDGALYVVDFYRQVIEGPEFMAKEVLDTIDLYNGTNKGRIYRISAKNAGAPGWTKGLQLGETTSDQLVEKLADKNIWWRLNAQRLLVDRNDKAAVPALEKMIKDQSSSLGRLHALWTLEGMRSLSAGIIKHALNDPEPGIRENAIRLAELHLNEDAGLAASLPGLQNDADPRVRFQLLLTLGYIHGAGADTVRQALLFKDINDPWMQIAALSASSSQAMALLDAVLEKFEPDSKAYALLVEHLGAIVGAGQKDHIIERFIQEAIAVTPQQDLWQAPLLEGLANGLKSRKSLPGGMQANRGLLIQSCLENPSMPVRSASLQMLRVIGLPGNGGSPAAMQKAIRLVRDTHLSEEQRAYAVDFLSLQNPQPYAEFLKGLVDPREPLRLQLSAVNALKQIPGTAISGYFLSRWSALSPGVRTAVISACMMTDDRIGLLLDAMESGTVNLGDVSWSQSVRLRSLGNIPLRMRARALFAKKDDKLKEVIQEYQGIAALQGDPSKGKTVFLADCAVCHQVGGKMGRAYGPDMGTVHAWAPADIMVNILDPNRSIAIGYDTWEVTTSNGESVQGIISAETPTAITVNDANGQVRNIARQDIESLKALGISAMPVGLEEKISKQQMADLIAFLKQGE